MCMIGQFLTMLLYTDLKIGSFYFIEDVLLKFLNIPWDKLFHEQCHIFSKFFEVDSHSKECKLRSWKRLAQFLIFKSEISLFRVKSYFKHFREYALTNIILERRIIIWHFIRFAFYDAHNKSIERPGYRSLYPLTSSSVPKFMQRSGRTSGWRAANT